MEGTIIILKQIISMFVYMTIGWSLYKKQLITKEGSKSLAHLLLYVILPCVIVKSFYLERNLENSKIIGLSFAGAIIVLAIAVFISHIIFKERAIDEFGAAFSNAGFMGIPMITAVIGEHAVVYVAAMIALLNALQWTYGQMILSRDKSAMSPKAVATSPLVIALGIGLIIFILQIPVPGLLMNCMTSISHLNAPIAMIVLGIYLGEVRFKKIFLEKMVWYCSFVRLILIPMITLVVLKVIFKDYLEFGQALLISSIAPVGSNVAVYAQKLGKDYGYAVKCICLSTLLSIITMPIIMLIYEMF